MQDPKSVERLRRGDGTALKRLFKADHAKLFPLVYRLTKDREKTDEIIREAFKQLWENRRELDPFEVLFLRVLSYARTMASEYREANGIEDIEYGVRSPAGEDVAKRLEGVPEQERLMYLLHIVDGYSVRELARAFGISEDEVRERVGASLVSLDRELERPVEPTTPGTTWQ